ncbi:hypothetical protein M0R45_019391 [Rubus argutus]|uniref:Uncharacterized protein n=1 Tax=Rubus argutus TaxID=59490 RepID=A0AAW1X806_RUBAR
MLISITTKPLCNSHKPWSSAFTLYPNQSPILSIPFLKLPQDLTTPSNPCSSSHNPKSTPSPYHHGRPSKSSPIPHHVASLSAPSPQSTNLTARKSNLQSSPISPLSDFNPHHPRQSQFPIPASSTQSVTAPPPIPNQYPPAITASSRRCPLPNLEPVLTGPTPATQHPNPASSRRESAHARPIQHRTSISRRRHRRRHHL